MVDFSFPDLKGKTFVVSGSSSGMGKQIALLLGQQGANVGLLDLVASKEVAEEIEKMQSGAQTIILKADVTKGAEIDAAYDQVVAKFGKLDGGANMAGISGIDDAGDPNNTVEKLPDSHWEKVMAINVDGVRNCMRAQLRLMKGTGSIVNAASISGQVASPWSVPYSVSKFGVIGLTKGAAGEVGSRGIRVNAVAP
jgi:3-oxoacyl-[acyl-carrier protein] reductase